MTNPIIELENVAGLQDKPMLPRAAQQTEEDDLEQVRRRGYATAEHLASHGFFGVAVPIFDLSRELVATLTLFGPKQRINPEMRTQYTRLLKHAAGRLSLKLGAREPADAEGPRLGRYAARASSRAPSARAAGELTSRHLSAGDVRFERRGRFVAFRQSRAMPHPGLDRSPVCPYVFRKPVGHDRGDGHLFLLRRDAFRGGQHTADFGL
jgi:hypothetical protein